jgi:AcrR family transcriptional regulator
MSQATSKRRVHAKGSFKQEQLRHREDALVKAAEYLFSSRSYERTTIEDVIGFVGISKPTFYTHFASKEALAVKVIVSGLETALHQVEVFAATMPPGDAARAMIDWAIDNQSNPTSTPTFPGSLAFFDHDEVLAAESRLTVRLSSLINLAQQEGPTGKFVNAHTLSRIFRSILKDSSFFDKSGDRKQELEDIKDDIKSILLG